MPSRPERSIHELYRDDVARADAIAFGRRGALRGASLAAMGAALGATIPFAGNMPAGLLPAAFAQPTGAGPQTLSFPGKAPLILLGDRPLVAETPEHMLDDDVTPFDKFFIRNNGQIPPEAADRAAWRVRIDGEVATPLELSVGELESRFPQVTLRLQMECGGNGRSFYVPETRGNQWGNGAISCGEWTGARLADVLRAAGIRPSAVYTGHYGADPHLSGATDRPSISRGVPIAKAMEPHGLIATRLNGAAIPHIHGAPVRLVIPGWPGSVSQKWLTRIWVRDREHDGSGMGQTSYRLPIAPMVPGGRVDETNFRIMESMPVRSVLTSHAHGTRLPAGTGRLAIRGQAWAGDLAVRAVDVSIDYGSTWQAMAVAPPPNPYAWQRWSGEVAFPGAGYYEIWYRATDARGAMQPHVAPNWNPQGYGGNPVSRAAVLIAA
jgi:DMSO/TMAO reductase YedYZ molybdopterin-dependent catalytic subunit